MAYMAAYMAYFLHHSLASWLYLVRSVLKILAISGTRGSSGFGSQSSEQMDRSTWGSWRSHWIFKTFGFEIISLI